MTALLDVRSLSKHFGAIRAVDDVSFTLAKGEMLALIGPNGAGKSTCFNMLMGQLTPDNGRVILDGTDITGLPTPEIWRRGVGRTFQITATYSSMTVMENVQMALLSHHGQVIDPVRAARRQHIEEALALLIRVDMADQASRAAGVLAYGDLKRLELAIALANEPALLLMDEPTAGMAPGERAAMMALTAEIVVERNIGVLFTEHDMDAVFTHAHRVLVLDRGRLIAEGSVDEIRANPDVQKVYLGDDLDDLGGGIHA